MKRILIMFLFLFTCVCVLTVHAGEQKTSDTVAVPGGEMTVKPIVQIEEESLPIPLIPEEIIRVRMEIHFLQETLRQLEEGDHPALKELENAMAQAKQNLELVDSIRSGIEKKLPEAWNSLSEEARKTLISKLMEDPTLDGWQLREYKGEMGQDDFDKLLEELRRYIPILKECQRVQTECEIKLNSGTKDGFIKSLTEELAAKKEFLNKKTEEFKKTLILGLLKEAPGYGVPNARFPYDYLKVRIGNFERYDFGWKKDQLLDEADKLWKSSWAGARMVKTVNGIEYAFRWCPAGSFLMGSPSSESNRGSDETQHRVTLTRGFWMLETEVTQAMWESVMGTSISQQRDKADTSWPLRGEGSNYPMYYVSWEECRSFCEKLSSQLGLTVSLPTEAQWEYACRAGTTGAYAGDLDEMGWYESNSGSKTHPVGEKKPNAWGLYDMHGNVWEWCQDWFVTYSTSPASDPCMLDSNGGSCRVDRGGSWNCDARNCRSAGRDGGTPDVRYDDLGFRTVLASPVPEE